MTCTRLYCAGADTLGRSQEDSPGTGATHAHTAVSLTHPRKHSQFQGAAPGSVSGGGRCRLRRSQRRRLERAWFRRRKVSRAGYVSAEPLAGTAESGQRAARGRAGSRRGLGLAEARGAGAARPVPPTRMLQPRGWLASRGAGSYFCGLQPSRRADRDTGPRGSASPKVTLRRRTGALGDQPPAVRRPFATSRWARLGSLVPEPRPGERLRPASPVPACLPALRLSSCLCHLLAPAPFRLSVRPLSALCLSLAPVSRPRCCPLGPSHSWPACKTSSPATSVSRTLFL